VRQKGKIKKIPFLEPGGKNTSGAKAPALSKWQFRGLKAPAPSGVRKIPSAMGPQNHRFWWFLKIFVRAAENENARIHHGLGHFCLLIMSKAQKGIILCKLG
jgi:hypothetical protein